MILTHPLPFLVFLWLVVYEKWPPSVRLTVLFLICIKCLFRRGFPELSPVIQIAVIPFEIDVPRHVNLDDCAVPRIGLLPILPVLPGVLGLPRFAVVVS